MTDIHFVFTMGRQFMTLERIPVPAGMIPVLMLVVLVVPACSQDPTAELRGPSRGIRKLSMTWG
jgi:hypothetical protein